MSSTCPASSMDSEDENDAFLPDIPEEDEFEKLAVIVKKANTKFVKASKLLIEYFTNGNKYPEAVRNNKSRFRTKLKTYTYDAEKCILYKVVKRSDGIERFLECVLDENRQEKLISQSHHGINNQKEVQAASGHFGRDRVYAILSERYFFPYIRQRVCSLIKTCETCQMNNCRRLEKTGHKLRSIEIPNKAFYLIGIDLVGPFKKSIDGFCYLCMVMDYYTKYPECQALKSKSAEGVAQFVYSLICRYGMIPNIVSDNGLEFNNALLRSLTNLTGAVHRVCSPYHPQACGMIERLNRTVQEIISKTMHSQEDWLTLVPSVMFSLRVSRQASTGFSPFSLLFNRQPLLPFEYEDKREQEGWDAFSKHLDECDDPVGEVFQHMEAQRQSIFAIAGKNIKRAQTHQAKAYNKRNSGSYFKRGDKVLKRNMRDKGRKEKLTRRFTGPYEVVGMNENGSYYLKDKYSHTLKRPVPPVQLVRFNEKKKKSTDQSSYDENADADGTGYMYSESSDDDLSSSCQRASCYEPSQNKTNSSLFNEVQSQITIIPSRDGMFSSDESVDIDVEAMDGSLSAEHSASYAEPMMNVSPEKKTSVQFVDSLHSDGEDIIDVVGEECEESVVSFVEPPTVFYFKPLTFEQRILVCQKLGLVIRRSKDPVKWVGIGKELKNGVDLIPTIKSAGNGSCMFISLSLLLTGRPDYSTIIRHRICNFIEDPANYAALAPYLSPTYKSGKMYILSNMVRNLATWASEVEIYAFSLLSTHPVLIYSVQKSWVQYFSDHNNKKPLNSFHMTNESGQHFDAIFSIED